MAFTGSAPNKTYQRTDGTRTGSAVNATAKAAGVNNTAALADIRENDIATALSTSWQINGDNQPSADLPMNTHVFTGMGQGSTRTGSLRIDQVQDGDLVYAAVGGTANAIELTLTPVSGGGVAGMSVCFIPSDANTSAVTIDLDGDGAEALQYKGAALSGGELVAGQPVFVVHDGTNWHLLASSNFATLTALASTANGYGASLIGIEDSGALITATDVEGALAENRTAIDAVEASVATIQGDYLTSSDIGSTAQAYDATLDAFAAYNTNGMLTQTAADTFTGRTITGTANQIDVANGDGVSGNPTLSLDSDQTTKTLTYVIDGGGSEISTGVKGFVEVPFACTITQVTALADQSGSIVVDIWKDTYANYPPTDADSITASAPVTISTATKAQDATLTGWTKSITAGDILGFNVDSVTTCQRVTISLKVSIP